MFKFKENKKCRSIIHSFMIFSIQSSVQHIFLSKHIFHVPSFAPGLLLFKMSGLNSIASEISIKKLLFLGRLVTEPSMALTVRNLLELRAIL